VTREDTRHPDMDPASDTPPALTLSEVIALPPDPEPNPQDMPLSAPASPAFAAGGFKLTDVAPENWCYLLEVLGLGGIVYNIASHCELRNRAGYTLEFVLDMDNASLFNDSHGNKLRLALENYFGQPLTVTVTPAVLQRETPAMRTERLASLRQQEAVLAIEADQQLQALIARFDGELDRSSIVPTDV